MHFAHEEHTFNLYPRPLPPYFHGRGPDGAAGTGACLWVLTHSMGPELSPW